MDARDLAFAGAGAQAQLLADGAVSAPELLEVYLERIARLDNQLGCYRVVRTDSARDEAYAAQDRLDAGERLPLLGVPIAIKDDVDVAGEVTASGSGGRRTRRHLRRRGGPATARRGRGHHGQNQCAGTDDLSLHRVADFRSHP